MFSFTTNISVLLVISNGRTSPKSLASQIQFVGSNLKKRLEILKDIIMKGLISVILILCYFNFNYVTSNEAQKKVYCECDTNQVKIIIGQKEFNSISQYDIPAFEKDSFYTLDSSINRLLWYRDIENPDTTKFTNLWNDYKSENYHASHLDFVDYYLNRQNIELAIQLGPNNDLWAYRTYVFKKINCCYLVTHSYFRHARFVYKSYSILDKMKIDSLFKIIDQLKTSSIVDKPKYSYSAYFADNRNSKKYYIDLENGTKSDSSDSSKTINLFYDFLGKKIKWTKTYRL